MRLQREAIAGRGDLRLAASERNALLARRTRLEAEMKGVENIVFPPELASAHATNSVSQALQEEQLIFQARRESFRSQTEALEQLKLLVQRELESLTRKDLLLDRQLTSARKELESVYSLVSRGLAVTPRQFALEQTTSQLEGSRLDLGSTMLRARQDISKAERDLLELRNKRQNDILVDLRQTQMKLDELAQRMQTSERLLQETDLVAPLMAAEHGREETAQPIYSIIRTVNGSMQEHVVSEIEAVQPGDTVRVVRPINPSSQSFALRDGSGRVEGR